MDYTQKVTILAQEDPSTPLFKETCKILGIKGIEPLDFIKPESHTLLNIYKNIFKDDMANQLMGYLVHKHDKLLVWEVIDAIYTSKEDTILVNTTLLTNEDIEFIQSTIQHALTYTLEGRVITCAHQIYDGVKNYKDTYSL